MLAQITPLILTFNEAPNLERCLERLLWAKEIVIIDSFSTDETLAIARKFSQVRVVQRKFDAFAGQRNFGIQQTNTPWVLSLDADYILSETFVKELETWPPKEEVSAGFARFQYCIFGRRLRGTLYPPRAVMFRKGCCHYLQDGHAELLQADGPTVTLSGTIDHDDRKPLTRWLWAQDDYAILEAAKLREVPGAHLYFQDRLRRKIILAPAAVFFYTLLGKGLILDGWPGWYYVFQRTLAEIMLSLRLLEAKLKSRISVR